MEVDALNTPSSMRPDGSPSDGAEEGYGEEGNHS
jgi:hypothetical protein